MATVARGYPCQPAHVVRSGPFRRSSRRRCRRSLSRQRHSGKVALVRQRHRDRLAGPLAPMENVRTVGVVSLPPTRKVPSSAGATSSSPSGMSIPCAAHCATIRCG